MKRIFFLLAFVFLSSAFPQISNLYEGNVSLLYYHVSGRVKYIAKTEKISDHIKLTFIDANTFLNVSEISLPAGDTSILSLYYALPDINNNGSDEIIYSDYKYQNNQYISIARIIEIQDGAILKTWNNNSGSIYCYPFLTSGNNMLKLYVNFYISGEGQYAYVYSLGTIVSAEPTLNEKKDFLLNQNYPNPFNPVTTISFELTESSEISIDIYDTEGSIIRHLVKDKLPAGRHSVIWDGKNEFGRPAASGRYFYSLNDSKNKITKKMVLLK